MANNCLVTKLKGVVDNSDLAKIGEIEIQVTNPDYFTVLSNGNSPRIRANSSVLYYYDANHNKVGEPFAEGTVYDYDSGKVYGVGVASGYTGKVWLLQNYNSLDIELSGGIADFSFLQTCRAITCRYDSVQIQGYPKVSHEFFVRNIRVNNIVPLDGATSVRNDYASSFVVSASPGTATINLTQLIQNWPNIITFQAYNSYITESELGLADLGKLVNLNRFNHVASVSWRLEDFVANKRSAGVTSGSCEVIYAGDDSAGGVASFNGHKMSSDATTFTWTPTTITYNGETITA